MNERRFFQTKVEVRDTPGEPRTVAGYAARYSSMTDVGGQFCEVIAPGAFDSAKRRGDDIRLLRDHEPSMLLARSKSGTLQLDADDLGLVFRAELPNTQLADETYELVKRGDLSGCSFGFIVGKDNDDWTEEEDSRTGKRYVLRTIRDFQNVFDVSICAFPQYDSTSVTARNQVSDGVLAEARSRAARIVGGHVTPSGYRRMTDAEIAAAAAEERRAHPDRLAHELERIQQETFREMLRP